MKVAGILALFVAAVSTLPVEKAGHEVSKRSPQIGGIVPVVPLLGRGMVYPPVIPGLVHPMGVGGVFRGKRDAQIGGFGGGYGGYGAGMMRPMVPAMVYPPFVNRPMYG